MKSSERRMFRSARRGRVIASTAAALIGSSIGVSAQESNVIESGTRVRISAPSITPSRLVGTVSSVTTDSILLVLEGAEGPVALPLSALERLEVRRLKRGSAVVTGIGAIVGLGLGLAEAIRVNAEECDRQGFLGELCALNDIAWVAAPVAYAAVGTAAGYLVGLLFKTERWSESRIPRSRVAVGFGVGPDAAIAFSAKLRL